MSIAKILAAPPSVGQSSDYTLATAAKTLAHNAKSAYALSSDGIQRN